VGKSTTTTTTTTQMADQYMTKQMADQTMIAMLKTMNYFVKNDARHIAKKEVGTTPTEQFTKTIFGCLNCQRTGKLKVCAYCRAASYCDAACQRADWPAHKEECEIERSRLVIALHMANFTLKREGLEQTLTDKDTGGGKRNRATEDIAIFIRIDGFAGAADWPQMVENVTKLMQDYTETYYPHNNLVGRRMRKTDASGTLTFSVYDMPWDGVAGMRIDRYIDEKTYRYDNEVTKSTGLILLTLEDLDKVVSATEMVQINEQLKNAGVILTCRLMTIRIMYEKSTV
jgi:hypothetical protein